MALDLFKTKGTPLDRQTLHLARPRPAAVQQARRRRVHPRARHPHERHRVRGRALRARLRAHERRAAAALARVRRVEQHQQTMVNWLNPADQSPLETTIGFEQVAIEVTASVAQHEPDPYLAQVYRFGLLEDFDHLYRYSALMDRLEGKDANALLQSLHRHPAGPAHLRRAPRSGGRPAPPVRSRDGRRRSRSSTRSRSWPASTRRTTTT